jgi:type VI secretion system protein VasG
VESGARNVDNILTNTLLPDVSRTLLEALTEGVMPSSMYVDIDESGGFVYK